ncbi:hypothetical protein VTP01DRAFT_10410 [Rhizomucor pusillus]|uniref:uncharacterized protein n=1 Tax=Rhizomucor pusillus TaxID=4840 RepID=UPI0037435F29
MSPPPMLAPPSSSKGNRRVPGLKLSFEHLQPAAAVAVPEEYEQPANHTFREQVDDIVSGNNSRSAGGHHSTLAAASAGAGKGIPRLKPRAYPGCGAEEDDDDEEESLAAAFLQQARIQSNNTFVEDKRKNSIPVLREAPEPPPPSSNGHHPYSTAAVSYSSVTSTPAASYSSSSSTSSSTSSTTADNNAETNSNFMEIKPEDLETIKQLGEGSAGTVTKVLHKPTNLIMAKKVIATDPNPKIQRQILRELSFQKTCKSPYIVSFYGAFLEDGDTMVTLCMEYCEAGSLEDIYKRARDMGGVIGEPVLERIAESVCKGLVYLHSQRVIHRDIKPSNILVTRKGEIKLCDFGVSGELINSIAKTFTGTKYYMAPERIQGAPYAVQSDIWSLGLTLIEVSQNRPALPPPGQSQLSVIDLLYLIVRQPVPVIQGDHISKECRNFVAVCLIKDPKDRPGPARMLEHPFIKKWEKVPMDLAKWVKEVWDWKDSSPSDKFLKRSTKA